MRRYRPTFDEVEPPRVETTPIDGLTDEQWAERNERRGEVIRRISGVAFGVAFGIFTGFLAVTRLNPGVPHYDLAVCLVMAGCVIAFVAIFTSKRDRDVGKVVGWILWPEWMVLGLLPWWVTVALGLVAIALIVLVVGTIAAGHLPWPFD